MKTALYPGSFDPVTNGHLDIIERSARLFEKVIVAIASNSGKTPLFETRERIEMLKNVCSRIKNVEVITFDGLLVEAVGQFNACAVIRGLRAVSDFEYEFQMALMNREINRNCETLFMMPSPEYSFVSSKLIKEIVHLGGNIEAFVPPVVIGALKHKLGLP
jgi:pantetheine-phosphate adenylyltransferase